MIKVMVTEGPKFSSLTLLYYKLSTPLTQFCNKLSQKAEKINCLSQWPHTNTKNMHKPNLHAPDSAHSVAKSRPSLTQCGQASFTLQPDSGLFNSLGAGVVKLKI